MEGELPNKRASRRYRPGAIDRRSHAREAVALFNRGEYWEAHEQLEYIWRSIPDDDEALIIQGLIQAAAALLHRERGNRHGVAVVGRSAIEKLSRADHTATEFDTQVFSRDLEQALEGDGPPPTLKLRTA